MKSDYNKIKQDLYNLYPNTNPELIDDLIKIYFKKAKEAIASFNKPNVALLWTTATIKPYRIADEITVLEVILKNRNNPEINIYTEEELLKKEEKLNKLKRVLAIYKETQSHGKTMRHKRRKNETKSD